MAKAKPDRRLSPITHVRAWVDEVAALCVPEHDPSEVAGVKVRLFAASELALHYAESTFTQASARDIATSFTFGRFPSVAELRKAIEAWRKSSGEKPTASRLLLNEDRLSDPRVGLLTFEDKAWIARWDIRIGELRAGGDPLWDGDAAKRARSKRATLASCIRQYSPAAWAIIARPYQASREIPEAEFIREHCNLYDRPKTTAAAEEEQYFLMADIPESAKQAMRESVAKHRGPEFRPSDVDLSNTYFKVVKVKRSHNGKRSILTCEDPKEFYQTDPMSPNVEALLGKRSHCYIVLAIDVAAGIAHFGPELGGLTW